MNQPIGIPSGWEEIAAAMAIWEDREFLYGRLSSTGAMGRFSAEDYARCTHDWRVEA